MADSKTLRGVPPLLPPSRPKKSPSPQPRLTPRRSSRRRFSRSQPPRNQENNNAGPSSGAQRRSTSSSLSRIHGANSAFSIPTSPMKTSSASSEKGRRPLPASSRQPDLDSAPLSPTRPPAHPTARSSKATNSDMSVFDFTDDDAAPLTPRNLVMDHSAAAAADSQIALTPPVNSPTPLVVSAKRFGSKVKRNYATKRRRPDNDDESTSSSDEDDTMKLPEDLSPTKRAQEYWKRCYGSKKPQELLVNPQMSWSAKRAAPAKSCLSHSKPKRRTNSAQILLPPASAMMHSPPPLTSKAKSPLFSTPTASPEEIIQPQPKCSHSKSVQFGAAQAAEYDLDAPSGRFTPLPFDVAQERFPLNANKQEEEGEQKEIAETKENSAMLAEWEDDFDTLAEESGTDDETIKTSKHRKRSSSKRRQSLSSKRHRKGNRGERRRSSAFCSPHNAKALYDPSMDAEITPDKQKVIDNMASLSVASPSPNHPCTEPAEAASDDDTTRSESMSPVPTRRLSTEANMDMEAEQAAIISQEDEMDTPPPNESKAGRPTEIVNVWTETSSHASVLSQENETWDVRTVFGNLAMAPKRMWNGPLESNERVEELVDVLAGWHSSMQQPFRKALTLLSNKLKASQPKSIALKGDEQKQVPQDLKEKFERQAFVEWRKVEADFLKTLVLETTNIKRQVARRSMVLDSAVVPEKASLEPTRKGISEAEESIRKLESLLKSEAEVKHQLQQRHDAGQLQSMLFQAPFAALSHHAVQYLRPVGAVLSPHQSQAIFNHLLEGLDTRLEFDGSGTSVSQTSDSDEISMFCNGMISNESGQLQGGFLELAECSGTWSDMLLQLAVLLGRVDLAALTLQELANAYAVSLSSREVEGQPVLVVQVQLPHNTVLNASYRRGNAKSMYWSIPSKLEVQQNGQPVKHLLGPLSQLVNSSRGVVATAKILQVACQTVLTELSINPQSC